MKSELSVRITGWITSKMVVRPPSRRTWSSTAHCAELTISAEPKETARWNKIVTTGASLCQLRTTQSFRRSIARTIKSSEMRSMDRLEG
jgi:hypothetical protein